MFNQCAFVGRLGKDPEIKYFEGGKAKTTFKIAVDRQFKRAGEPDADWFRVELWGKQAENAAEWLKKGSTVAVGGRLEMEKWQGRDGEQVTPTLKDAHFRNLTPKDGAKAASKAPAGELDDELPW